MTSLRNIAFRLQNDLEEEEEADFEISYAWISRILSQVTHASLESVTLVTPREGRILFAELPALEAVFMTPIFSNSSTKLCFNNYCGYNPTWITDHDRYKIEDCFPRLYEQGRLEFKRINPI